MAANYVSQSNADVMKSIAENGAAPVRNLPNSSHGVKSSDKDPQPKTTKPSNPYASAG